MRAAAAAPPLARRAAGLLLPTALLAALLLASTAAAGSSSRVHPAGLLQHKHFPRMDPEQQKLQSLQQEKNYSKKPQKEQQQDSSSKQQQQAQTSQQVVAPGPLLPSCVPKFVTDLVIPPPMPVSVVPMSLVGLLTGVGVGSGRVG